ncbi:MAG: DUF4398 domain-containing protein [Rhodoferax sp.]
MNTPRYRLMYACMAGALALSACSSSLKTPATADVAVSQAAVESAVRADGTEFAPADMQAARDKLALAKKALAAKDYKAATDYATQAQADAKLAQAKAGSAKSQAVAETLQEDIRVLRVELDRARTQ